MLKYGRIEVDETHKPIKYQINSNGCHEVISHADRSNGYCCIKMNGKVLDIHRWYYQKMNPNINLTDLVVRHKCDNRKCINLEHLEHGTQKDNVIDMFKRERGHSKFTLKECLMLKILLEEDCYTYLQLANLFDTSIAYISEVARGLAWQWFTNFKQNKYSKIIAEKHSGEKYILWSKSKQVWLFDYKYNKSKNRVSKSFKYLNDAIEFKKQYFSTEVD